MQNNIPVEPQEKSWDDICFTRVCYCVYEGMSLQEACFKMEREGYSHGNVMRRWKDAHDWVNKPKISLDEALKRVEKEFNKGEIHAKFGTGNSGTKTKPSDNTKRD